MEMVGGYRLVRKLGAGQRADVYLGYAGAFDQSEAAADHPRSVAIKCYRPGDRQHNGDARGAGLSGIVPRDTGVEVAALSRVSSPHIVRLLDIATVDGGLPCLILQRVNPVGLTRLLTARRPLAAGEAVTVLAPVAGALRQLHLAGVSHGKVAASNVLFDDSAAPVLSGFGHAQLFGDVTAAGAEPSPHRRSADAGVARDLGMLAGLARSVLDRVQASSAAGSVTPRLLDMRLKDLNSWLSVPDSDQRAEDFAEQLAERLFDLAPALPVRLGESPATITVVPSRLELPLGQSAGGEPDRSGWLTRMPLPEWLPGAFTVRPDPALLATLGRRFSALLGSVKRPVLFGAIAALALSVFALVAVPAGGGDGTPIASSESRGPAASSPPHSPIPPPSSQAVGDDPVAALSGLLAVRAGCILTLSIRCLEDVDQEGSAALRADQAVIRSRQQGGSEVAEPSIVAASIRMIDRMGDVALLGGESDQRTATGANPVSILLVKGESGWRIRDIVRAAR